MPKSGCPTRSLSLTKTDNRMVTAFRVDREERGQSATHGIHQKLALEYCCPGGGLSSKEFFGLHCQMPVQLCNGVVGHLADLFLYEPNGVLRDLVL